MEILDTIVLIPSLNPNERLIKLVHGIQEEGVEWILVVDDGSDPEYADIFQKLRELDCFIVHHERNLGKGAAIKTALRAAIEKCGGKQDHLCIFQTDEWDILSGYADRPSGNSAKSVGTGAV